MVIAHLSSVVRMFENSFKFNITMKKQHFLLYILVVILSTDSLVGQTVYKPSTKDSIWATQFQPISGAGTKIIGNGHGGWRSGTDGVRYKGDHPRPEYNLNFDGVAKGTAVEKGLLPPIKPAIELHLRDSVITLGGDGYYYLTGSSGDNIWAYTAGVELWKSKNLTDWSYVGLVWDIDKDADDWVKVWREHPKRAVRAVWAPEIHYIKNNYYICFSMCPSGIGILKSSTGMPEGPYVNAFDTEGSIADGIDPTLFQDDDGKVYLTYGAAKEIVQLKDDLSGFAGSFKKIEFTDHDTDPTHHAQKCEARGMHDLGHEGAVLFKRNGKYYLGAADNYEGRYSTCLAMSDNLTGPYIMRHESVPSAGGTGFFKDKKGEWWSTYFGNDSQVHFREKVGLIKIDFNASGKVYPAKQQPFVSKEDNKKWLSKWKSIWKIIK